MRPRIAVRVVLVSAFLMGTIYAVHQQPQPFHEYPGVEYERFALPRDYREKTEWAFARLMYPPVSPWNGGFQFFGDWKFGASNWTMDYPRSDRHFAIAIRRLTRLHVRSVEQPVNLDDGDDVFDWPWIYGVEVGHWNLTDAQAKKMREYLLRGGFFMCDDFHGSREWEMFTATMRKVFPERAIVELDSSDPVFHVLYDLDDRYQVPGAQYLQTGRVYEMDGREPRWRGIYDDQGRLMVAICHNMDLGDSWEWADVPAYPEKFSALGIRIAVNYVLYAMTH